MSSLSPSVSAPEVVFYDGAGAREIADAVVGAYREVYADAAGLPDHLDFADRFARHTTRPGFVLMVVYGEGSLIGFAYGYTLFEGTTWWDGVSPPPTPDLVAEWPGRTFALCEGLVRPSYVKNGHGERGLAILLSTRTEERATALVAVSNDVVLGRYEAYGWQKVGEVVPFPGWRPHAVLLIPLR